MKMKKCGNIDPTGMLKEFFADVEKANDNGVCVLQALSALTGWSYMKCWKHCDKFGGRKYRDGTYEDVRVIKQAFGDNCIDVTDRYLSKGIKTVKAFQDNAQYVKKGKYYISVSRHGCAWVDGFIRDWAIDRSCRILTVLEITGKPLSGTVTGYKIPKSKLGGYTEHMKKQKNEGMTINLIAKKWSRMMNNEKRLEKRRKQLESNLKRVENRQSVLAKKIKRYEKKYTHEQLTEKFVPKKDYSTRKKPKTITEQIDEIKENNPNIQVYFDELPSYNYWTVTIDGDDDFREYCYSKRELLKTLKSCLS